jgi:hypothetical protein
VQASRSCVAASICMNGCASCSEPVWAIEQRQRHSGPERQVLACAWQ